MGNKGISSRLRRALRLRQELSFGFYFTDFLFRKLFRQNSGVGYPVHHTATIHTPQKLSRGVGTWPGDSPGVYINAANGVYIGDFTNLGPNVGIVSANHDFKDNDVATPAPPIRIGAFCWLGMSAVVLPGVVLGDFTIVGAGAIVTKPFPDGYCVIAGSPAKKIKELDKTACDAHAARKYKTATA